LSVGIGIHYEVFGQTTHKVWCWITIQHEYFRLGLLYGPLTLMWIFNLFIIVLLTRQAHNSLAYDFIVSPHRTRLRLYLLVFVCSKLPALANRIAEAITGQGHDIFALLLIQAIFDSLFGFCNSIVYGVTFRRIAIKAGFWCWEQAKDQLDPVHQREVYVPSITDRMRFKRRPTSPQRQQRAVNLSAGESHSQEGPSMARIEETIYDVGRQNSVPVLPSSTAASQSIGRSMDSTSLRPAPRVINQQMSHDISVLVEAVIQNGSRHRLDGTRSPPPELPTEQSSLISTSPTKQSFSSGFVS